MRKRILLISLVILLALPLFGACAKPAPEEKFQWKFQDLVAATSIAGVRNAKFCEEVGLRTNGRLTIDYYPLAGLGIPPPGLVGALREGVLDVAFMTAGHAAGEVLIADICDISGLMPSVLEIRIKAMEAMMPYFEKGYEEKGVILLTAAQSIGRDIYLREPITGVEDMRGLKIRSGGEGEDVGVTALGATPLRVNFGELYTAMERGTIDGFVLVENQVVPMKLYEVIKCWWDLMFGGITFHNAVSKASFDQLPVDIQEIVRKTAEEAWDGFWPEIENTDLEYREVLIEKGIIYIPPDPEVLEMIAKAGDEYQTKWAERVGPPAPEMLEKIKKIVAEYR